MPSLTLQARINRVGRRGEGPYTFGMDHYLKILLLALIQGAAELLPVSSSAHVIVAERLMGLDPSTPEMVFLLIMLHTGTMFAVLVYFWQRWRGIWLSTAAPEQSGLGESRYHFL